MPPAGERRRANTTSIGRFAVVALIAAGCAPDGEQGQCSDRQPCEGRGEICDVGASVCVPKAIDTSATERPAPSTFAQKPVPFHRGRACTVHEVRAGEAFPVFLDPCLHPCLELGEYQFKHGWSCLGSTCEAWVVMWVDASSGPEGCPPDAFSDFDPSQCSFDRPLEVQINPLFGDGSRVGGTMKVEIPFLTNTDIKAIAASDGDPVVIQAKIDQYPPADDRQVGNPVSLLAGNPVPPATCGDNGIGCDCSPIGL